jgi:hypothetical protein
MRSAWMLFYLVVVCGPVALMLAMDRVPQMRAATHAPRCQRPVPGSPGGVCGMPVAARISLLNGSSYQHHHWLCHEHALDAERRATDRFFQIAWLQDS